MRVLVIEADLQARKSLSETLDGWGYQVELTEDGAKALAVLQKEMGPRLLLMGSLVEADTARQLCRQIRELGERPYIYVVMLAPKGQSQQILESMEAGADDYLTVPFDSLELKARLRAGKRILDLREELERAQATIGYQAYHDPLTGLWNRGAILDALRRELARVRREHTPVGLIMASIDGLKGINESYGHMAGDAVIRTTARHLRASLRPYDALGRFGGEAFLMIVTGCDSRSAVKQAERFQDALKGIKVDISQWGKFTQGKETALVIEHSFGVISGTGENESDALVQSVEAALRKAKKEGGGRIEQAQPVPSKKG
jgi:diguanylate cyclase (GGDEF)-like protein